MLNANTGAIGAVAESIAATEFVKAGGQVYTPFVTAGLGPVDLVAGFGNKLFKVQVKCVTSDEETFTLDLGNKYQDDSFHLLCIVLLNKSHPTVIPRLFLMQWPIDNKRSINFNKERQAEYEFYRQINFIAND